MLAWKMHSMHELLWKSWSVLYVNEAGKRGERAANEQDGEYAEGG
jgi:hypothetical protein